MLMMMMMMMVLTALVVMMWVEMLVRVLALLVVAVMMLVLLPAVLLWTLLAGACLKQGSVSALREPLRLLCKRGSLPGFAHCRRVSPTTSREGSSHGLVDVRSL